MAETGISDQTSQRICRHMNDDHAVSVHAMVKNALPYREQLLHTIKDAQMTSISLTGYNLSFVVCDGDLCSRRSVTVNFVPPLSSSKECRYVQYSSNSFIFKFVITSMILLSPFWKQQINNYPKFI